MKNRFVVADLHLGHAGVIGFCADDGGVARRNPANGYPFASINEHDGTIVERWNEVIKNHNDVVYVLGDVAMHHKHLRLLHAMNGDKVLIKGNHDKSKLSHYTTYFRDIRACYVWSNYLLTHIPVHPDSVARWKGNIHGHLHWRQIDDPKYLCVSLEHTDMAPIHIDEAIARLEARKDEQKRTRTDNSDGGTS